MDIVTRLKQLAHAVADEDWSEFSMRVPADSERDADLVLLRASKEIESLRAELAGMTADLNRLRDALTTIKDLPDLSGFGASHETIFQMRIIARDALREEGDK